MWESNSIVSGKFIENVLEPRVPFLVTAQTPFIEFLSSVKIKLNW
jgi:hypothetical protein